MDFVIHGHVALVLEYEHSCQQRRLHRVPLYVPPFWVCALIGIWILVCLLLHYSVDDFRNILHTNWTNWSELDIYYDMEV